MAWVPAGDQSHLHELAQPCLLPLELPAVRHPTQLVRLWVPKTCATWADAP
jgi:hypothetical protein